MGLELKGTDALFLGLERLASLDVKSLRMRVAQRSQTIVEERIETGKRDLNGLAWARWSPSYARTRGPGHSLLVDTRRLLNSFNIADTGLETFMGTSVEYAKKNDQEREFMGLNRTSDVRSIQSVIDGWLRDNI